QAGVRVAPLCLGVMNVGGPTSEEDGIRMIHEALDAGVNFVDTANVYQGGRSEEIVGVALQGRRDEAVLATKVFNPMGTGPNDRGNSRVAIVRELENSLRRLQTDYVDLYQLHRFDETTPIEESLEALTDVVRQGKVRYVGISTFPAWRIAQAQHVAKEHGFVRIATEQPPYNLLEREVEREVVPACREYGMAIIPWSPLAGGLLSDRFRGGQAPAGARATEGFTLDAPHWADTHTAIDKLAALASEVGTTLSRVALAWLRDAPGVTSPIIGPRTTEQLRDALASLDVTVDDDQRKAVDEIVPPGASLWLKAAMQDWIVRAGS